jgi:uncharacterized BrkB/YihY/UPF0761 family membrane protein
MATEAIKSGGHWYRYILRSMPKRNLGIRDILDGRPFLSARETFLSFGFLATLWTASGGFAAAIEALNIAYDAEETRPFWKTRPLSMLLTLLIGLLLLVALVVMILSPHFGEWLGNRMHLSRLWLWAWPYIHWMISIGFTVLAVEALHFVAPNVKQRFVLEARI